jgi:hypothetical protein
VLVAWGFLSFTLNASIIDFTAAAGASGCTKAPTVTCTGPDDINTTTLKPYDWDYIASASLLNAALANSPFKGADNWKFDYSNVLIPKSDLTVSTYTAWAVTNDAITDPDGHSFTRGVTFADAGGANFILSYKPRPNSSDPPTIDFVQVFQQIDNGGAPVAHVDTASSVVPFYIQGGAYGNALERWMLDVPYTCESFPPGAISTTDPHCESDVDELTLSETRNFQTLVAVDDGLRNGIHHVTLYGGVSWGYTYTNTDTPEPAFGILSGVVLLGFAGLKYHRARRTDYGRGPLSVDASQN